MGHKWSPYEYKFWQTPHPWPLHFNSHFHCHSLSFTATFVVSVPQFQRTWINLTNLIPEPDILTWSARLCFQGSFLGGQLRPDWTQESEDRRRHHGSALWLEGQHRLPDLSQSREQRRLRTRQSRVQHHHQEATWVPSHTLSSFQVKGPPGENWSVYRIPQPTWATLGILTPQTVSITNWTRLLANRQIVKE